MDKEFIEKKARELRKNVIVSVHAAGSGHPGGSLSSADIMAVLYFHTMNIDPDRPDDPDRDRFVLSKGHAAPILYACLAEKGYLEKEELSTLRKMGSRLQGHPSKAKLACVEMSTGSLGQGVSAAVGMALGAKLDGRSCRVYSLLGDGELQEGIVWEALMSAAHYKLDNFCIIVDNNGLQIDGRTSEVMGVEPVADKIKAFGWEVECIDGHNVEEIASALESARRTKGRPFAIIAKTVKGKGVSFMEDMAGWHGKAPDEEQTRQALAELGGEL